MESDKHLFWSRKKNYHGKISLTSRCSLDTFHFMELWFFCSFYFRNNFHSIDLLRHLVPDGKKTSSDSSKFSRQTRYLLCFTSRAAHMWQHGFALLSTHTGQKLEEKIHIPDQRTVPAFPSRHLLWWKGYSYHTLHSWGMDVDCSSAGHGTSVFTWRE